MPRDETKCIVCGGLAIDFNRMTSWGTECSVCEVHDQYITRKFNANELQKC